MEAFGYVKYFHDAVSDPGTGRDDMLFPELRPCHWLVIVDNLFIFTLITRMLSHLSGGLISSVK